MAASISAPLRGPRFRSLQTLRHLRDPLTWYGKWLSAFGDPCLVPMRHGPIVLTANPTFVREVLTADPNDCGIAGRDYIVEVVGERSVLAATGAAHAEGRKLLAPAFQGDRLKSDAGRAVEVSLRYLAELKPGETIPTMELAHEISMDVILNALFGFTNATDLAPLKELLARYYATQTTALFMKSLRHRFGGVGPWARFVQAREDLDRHIHRIIEERRAGSNRSDVLGALLTARASDGSAVSAAEMRDQLVTLIGAGHGATAITIAWTMYFILSNPAVKAQVLAELASLGPAELGDKVDSLTYLDAVVRESMRLRPPVSEINRTAARPMELGGHKLAAGTMIIVAISQLHRRADTFEQPDVFRPERFMGKKYAPHEYLPFGGGARRCIGPGFAQTQIKLVLGTFLLHARLRLASSGPPAPIMQHGLLIAPDGGVPVVYEGLARAA